MSLKDDLKKRALEVAAAKAEEAAKEKKDEADTVKTRCLGYASSLLVNCQQAAEAGKTTTYLEIDYETWAHNRPEMGLALVAVGLGGCNWTFESDGYLRYEIFINFGG